MKILVVSDTHGRDRELETAVEREAPFDKLIHCGDVEGREIFIEALADCPCCIVAGNNDFFCDLPREQEITIGGKKALVTHGHYYGVSIDLSGIADEARSRGCEIAFFWSYAQTGCGTKEWSPCDKSGKSGISPSVRTQIQLCNFKYRYSGKYRCTN